MALFKSPIARVTDRIERALKEMMSHHTTEKFFVTHYGANDIHPRHLAYWIVVVSDREKHRLEHDAALLVALRGLLVTHNYPAEGREGVHIGFESQETVDRESNGNFWEHWK